MKNKNVEEEVDLFIMDFLNEFPDVKHEIIKETDNSPRGVAFNLDELSEEESTKLVEGLKKIKEKYEKL